MHELIGSRSPSERIVLTLIYNSLNICSSAASAVAVSWQLFEHAGTLTLLLLHSTEGTQLRSSLHYQSQLPSANHCNVREGRRLLCVEASCPSTTQFVIVCHTT